MEKICRACEIAANDELVKQMPMHTCGKDGPMENADALKTGMKEQDAAHSFEKTHPDFPEWIESETGKVCLEWPISEVKYLRNRLFWAFDAGRNCVWDQYINQKAELTRLRSELQQKDEAIAVLKKAMLQQKEVIEILKK